MADFFYNLFYKFNNFLGTEGIFILSLSIISILFLVEILRLVFVNRSKLSDRVWYFFAVLGVSGIEYSMAIITGNQTGYSLLTLSIGFLYLIPVLTVKNNKNERKKQSDFIKFIDEQISKENVEPKKTTVEYNEKFESDIEEREIPFNKSSAIEYFNKKSKENKVVELDFSHVKNVIERLDYINLSTADRRQVKELQLNVYQAENGVLTGELKTKINDGLGALLKIMSKHGV